MIKTFSRLFFLVTVTLLFACSDNTSNADLHAKIEQIKRQPKRPIDPLPAFKPYKALR